jgi:hypothetical protein
MKNIDEVNKEIRNVREGKYGYVYTQVIGQSDGKQKFFSGVLKHLPIEHKTVKVYCRYLGTSSKCPMSTLYDQQEALVGVRAGGQIDYISGSVKVRYQDSLSEGIEVVVQYVSKEESCLSESDIRKKLFRELKRKTGDNRHTEAYRLASEALGFDTLEKIFRGILIIQEALNDLPDEFNTFRHTCYKIMIEQASELLSPEEFKEFHNCF